MNIIETLENEQLRNDIPAFRPGDTVRVHVKVVEGKTERIQVFEGIVIARRNHEMCIRDRVESIFMMKRKSAR